MNDSRRTKESSISTFQHQVDRLVELGYPALADTTEAGLRAVLEPLRATAATLDDDTPGGHDTDPGGHDTDPGGRDRPGHAAYVVVVTRDLVRPEDTVPLLTLAGSTKPGKVDRNHAEGDLAGYDPIEASRPPGSAYLLVDVERGEEFCNVRPEDATNVVLGRGRSPLTVDEGIALVTQRPDLLEKNRCFMLAGSRRHDRRVPALWISERAPKLGWCWDGNPHTWLGLASAEDRLA